MWRNKLLLMVSAALCSLVFCQETDLKADFSSELSAGTARLGRLVVEKGVKLDSSEAEENNSSEVQDGLPSDSEGYQSDQPASAAESKLRHLNPSVHCGDDSMALRVKGYRLPHFMIDRGDDGLVPVSKMPASCGYSVKRARRDLLLVVHYQGCNVTQEGENYILPLHLWGTSMSMSCSVAPSAYAPNTTVPAKDAPASDPEQPVSLFPGSLPYRYRHPFYKYAYPWAFPTSPTTTAAPTTTATSTTAATSTTTAASTVATVPASDPQQPGYPFPGYLPYYRHPFYPYGYPWVFPTSTTAAPTTTASTTTAASTAATVPASDPQQPGYPFPGFLPYRHGYGFYPYGYPWVFPTSASTVAPTTTVTTAASTVAPTTTVTTAASTVAPTTTVTTAASTVAPATTVTTAASTATTIPANDPQQPGYLFPGFLPYRHRHPFYPYGYPWASPTSTPTTTVQTTASTVSTAPTAPASDPQQPGYLFPGYFPYSQKRPFYLYSYPWAFPTSTPTVAPASTVAPAATAAPTVPASDPQQPGYPFAQVYPFGYAPYSHRQFYQLGYPWVQPANAFPVSPKTPSSDPQKPTYPNPPFPMTGQEYQQLPKYYNLRPQDTPANWPCEVSLTEC